MIELDRELDELDSLVAEFVNCLGVRYVIVSGYVAILLGRARSTDDVDVIVEARSGSEVAARVERCGFKPLSIPAYIDAEFREASVRFYKPPRLLPNFEVKPPRSFYQRYALENRVEARVGGAVFYISPLELQIAYKLWLGSDKDIEDAVYIYRFGKAKGLLSEESLEAWARRMGVSLRSLRESGGGTYSTI
ncbi:MAG: hypothetical protein ACPL3C_03425 [Pyrobaculum sp.]|uniref:hypothetical protein n=2 Tax=unclassified Pyrobaculum TaxID=2643434 RepID=UPI003C822954